VRITPKTVLDRRRPEKLRGINVRRFSGEHTYANPNRLERKMHQFRTRPIWMHPRRRVEGALDYFEAQRRGKQNSQGLVGVTPEIPRPFVDWKREVGRMKSQPANF